jgi:aminoglycoside/choline kinase family phosphotransferase
VDEKTAAARLEALTHWLHHGLGIRSFGITPASSDASFRRYLRVRHGGQSHIVMDAPPEREDTQPFVAVARSFHDIGLHVPQILEADFEQGFLLLTDLGTRTYLETLNQATVERLYGDALGALVVLQACGPTAPGLLSPYDRTLLMNEMELFRHWLLQQHLGLGLSPAQHELLDETFHWLADKALEQPRVCVHRDYHSRNLMVTERNNPGILDFQDAVIGPVTYDLVSLLRDCYIAWPRERVLDWAKGYHDLAVQSGVLREEDEDQFLRWFDWMGVQRHLKAAGIFARLKLRDGKSGYIADIPRTLGYAAQVSGQYRELMGLRRLLVDEVLPRLA